MSIDSGIGMTQGWRAFGDDARRELQGHLERFGGSVMLLGADGALYLANSFPFNQQDLIDENGRLVCLAISSLVRWCHLEYVNTRSSIVLDKAGPGLRRRVATVYRMAMRSAYVVVVQTEDGPRASEAETDQLVETIERAAKVHPEVRFSAPLRASCAGVSSFEFRARA